jgi:hypothetical protein
MKSPILPRPLLLPLLVALAFCVVSRPAWSESTGGRFRITDAAIGSGVIARSADQRFDLAGSIVQTGAGRAQSPRFSLEDVELTFVHVLKLPGAPMLSLQQVPGDGVRLSWPATTTGFILQVCTDLSLGHWEPVMAPLAVTEQTHSVTLPMSGPFRLFRLVKP